MQPVRGSYNIIILGSWNPAIFSPQWTAQHLAQNPDSPVLIAYPVGPEALLPNRLGFEGIEIYPSTISLQINPERPTLQGLSRCTDIARTITELLGHTPVRAFGVNFVFEETLEPDRITGRLLLDDSALIDAGRYVLNTTSITRNFSVGDYQVNLNIEINADRAKTDFNFHHPISNTNECLARLNRELVAAHHEEALQFLNRVYDIQVDLENGDGQQP